jgi:hypothetical protein
VRWEKLGVVYRPDGSLPWARSHATCPTPVLWTDEVIRVYIQCRDDQNVGRVGYVEVAAADPLRLTRVNLNPVLDVGGPGTFDQDGVMQTCVLSVDDRLYMYYVGFELGTRIRYRLLTGLAISYDGGESFGRVRRTPILERSEVELLFRGGPWVLHDRQDFRMWYVAGGSWTSVRGKDMPVYDLRYLESADGLHWGDTGQGCLALSEPEEHGFGRPCIVRHGQGYQMFYSIRRRSLGRYRLGYAESADGKHWVRKDSELGLDVSASGWDAEAIMYAAPVHVRGNTFLFYNGNNFGETGFGVARLLR